jgi:transposase
MEKVGIVGLDIAKNSFHAHGATANGSKVFSEALPRGRVLESCGRIEPCTIALEACAGSHHRSRELLRLGHDVRLIAPQYVKPYVKRQKNDAKDAEAIAEAASRPTMRFATAKTTTQQGQAMVLKTRDLLTAQRSQTINALRGHLAEYGRVAPKRLQHLSPLEGALAENAERLPSDVTNLCQIFFDLIDGLSGRIDALTRQLRQVARHNDVARRLMTMPGIGPVTAVSIAMLAAPPEMFSKARHFAAWIGLASGQHSTGGKTRLGTISKMGQRDLRRLLIIGAMSAVQAAQKRGGAPEGSWLTRMSARKPKMLVAVALANIPLTHTSMCCRAMNGADGLGDHGSWRRLRDPCQRLSAKAGWGAVVLNGGLAKRRRDQEWENQKCPEQLVLRPLVLNLFHELTMRARDVDGRNQRPDTRRNSTALLLPKPKKALATLGASIHGALGCNALLGSDARSCLAGSRVGGVWLPATTDAPKPCVRPSLSPQPSSIGCEARACAPKTNGFWHFPCHILSTFSLVPKVFIFGVENRTFITAWIWIRRDVQFKEPAQWLPARPQFICQQSI